MDELTNLFLKYIEQRAANKTTGIQKPFFAVLSVPPPPTLTLRLRNTLRTRMRNS
jgi:hypothetical protein